MLPKKERSLSGREIKQILKEKQFKYSSTLLSMAAKEKSKENPRLVVVCSKALGNAVKRNRARRVIMQAYCNIWHNSDKKYDMVIIPRMANLAVSDCENDLKKAIIQ